MIAASLLNEFAAGRPDLPHPLEAPAITEEPCGPVPDYYDTLVFCRECDVPLAAREYDVDADFDGESFVFCGRDRCCTCQAERDDARAAERAAQ